MEDGDIEQKLIQQQMEETRASLSNKIDALEHQVADSVQTATDVVHDTTEAVAEITDKVGDTVRSVTHTFDLSRQVEERPWLVFGGSIGLGCLLGWYLPSRRRQHTVSGTPRSFAESRPSTEVNHPGWVSKQFDRLRGLAVGMVMGTVRDLAKENLPDAISTRVAEEVDNLTPHLGGEVIHGSILPYLKLQTASTAEEPRNEAGGRPAAFGPTEGEKATGSTLVGGWS